MAPPIDYYQMPYSAPCRLVTMTIKELGIEEKVNFKIVDLLKGDQFKPEFTSVNPQHVVPTLVDHENGLKVWESRAVAEYLENKYKPGSLLPTDIKSRATVNRHLYFDASTIYPLTAAVYKPVFLHSVQPDREKQNQLRDKLKFLDAELQGKRYVIGDCLTLADLSYLTTITFIFCISRVTGITPQDLPNIAKYIDGLKESVTSFFEVCDEPMKQFGEYIESKLPSVE